MASASASSSACRPGNDPPDPPASRPQAVNKWVTASVVEDAAEVFAEAERRDPHHRRVWVALVDGTNHQIQRIQP